MKRNLGYFKQDSYGERKPSMLNDFEGYKSKALKAAKDLYYGEECYKAIENAKDSAEISRIMVTYRSRRWT